MSEPYKCPACGATPVRETKPFMMGKVQDGGYPVTIGRYHCQRCGFGPSWKQSYSVRFDDYWEKAVEIWNKEVEAVMVYVEPEADDGT